MRDQFSEHYEDLLDGGYNCVDRIVLNAYFPMGSAKGLSQLVALAERIRSRPR